MTRARVFSQALSLGNVFGGGGGNVTLAELLPYLTTANVVEVSSSGNLYYSNSRVFANISFASINDLYDVETYSNTGNLLAIAGQGLVWNGLKWVPGNVAASFASITTDDITEGANNYYYTNARARTAFTAGTPSIIIDWNLGTISANLEAVAASANTTDSLPEGAVNLYYRDSRVHANLKLAKIGDLNDVYSVGEVYPAGHEYYTAEGNAIPNPGTGWTLVWNEAGAGWYPSPLIPAEANFANVAGAANVVLNLTGLTTNNLPEGNLNLYFTSGRVQSNVANLSINDLGDVWTPANGKVLGYVLTWDGNQWMPRDVANIGNVGSTAFSNFAENANRANTALFANVSGFTQSAETSNVANVAFFALVANSVLNAPATAAQVLSLSNFTTNDLLEGNVNLYYTEQRVYANVAAMSIDTLADVSTFIANVGEVLTWTGTTWVADSTVASAQSANFAENANVANTVLSLEGLTTDDLAEGSTNLYYTANRVANDLQSAILNKDIEVDDLIVNGDITVRGNTAILNVSNIRTESRVFQLATGSGGTAGAEGAGIYIDGANASFVYGQTNDGFGLNKNLTIYGNILPAVSGIFNIGAPGRNFRTIYLGAQTIYLGNTSISENPTGGLVVQDQFGNPAAIDLANIVGTEYVTVNRLVSGSATIENQAYIGGNTKQFTTNQTGNIYFGITKDGAINKFAGMRVVETRDNSPSVRSDLLFYTDHEGYSDSRAILSLLGTSNVLFNSNLITINNIKLIDNFGNFVGNAFVGTTDVEIKHGGTGANTRPNARRNLFSDFSNGLVAKIGGATNTLVATSIVAGTGVYVTDGDAQNGNPTIAIGQNVHPTASVTFSNVTVNGQLNSDDITAAVITARTDLIVQGNLTIRGNVTTINSTTVTIDDKNIVLANNAINASQADGAGITINGAGATFTYSESGDKFVANKNLEVQGNLVVNSGTGGTISGANTISTDTLNIIGDRVTVLSSVVGSPTSNASFVVNRGSSSDVDLRWNESIDRWQFTNDGTDYFNIPRPEEYDNVIYDVSIQDGTVPTSSANLVLSGRKSGNVVSLDTVEIVGSGTVKVTRTNDSTIDIAAGVGTITVAGIDNAGNYVLDQFSAGTYRSVKYVYTAKLTAFLSGGPEYASGELLVLHDGANAYITQYAMLTSTDDDLVTISADINNSNVRLLATATLGGHEVTVKLTGTTYTEI